MRVVRVPHDVVEAMAAMALTPWKSFWEVA